VDFLFAEGKKTRSGREGSRGVQEVSKDSWLPGRTLFRPSRQLSEGSISVMRAGGRACKK